MRRKEGGGGRGDLLALHQEAVAGASPLLQLDALGRTLNLGQGRQASLFSSALPSLNLPSCKEPVHLSIAFHTRRMNTGDQWQRHPLVHVTKDLSHLTPETR